MRSHRVEHDWSDLACMHACIGEGNGNPFEYSWLENPRDGWAWWTAFCGVSQIQTQWKWLSSSSSESKLNLLLFESYNLYHIYICLSNNTSSKYASHFHLHTRHLPPTIPWYSAQKCFIFTGSSKPQDRVNWGRLSVRMRPKEKHTELDDRGH